VQIVENATFPLVQPSNISLRHYVYLGRYFNIDREFDPRWFEAYAGTPNDEPNALEAPSYILRFNEFVLANQVILTSTIRFFSCFDSSKVCINSDIF
jgi:hypothetical protein